MSMLSKYIKRQVDKHGFVGIIIKVGDIAVRYSPSAKDDLIWNKVKKLFKEYYKDA